MDKDKQHDSSAFSVPGSMQDLTLMNTPVPQATSTATKRKSGLFDENHTLDVIIENYKDGIKKKSEIGSTLTSGSVPNVNENKRNTQQMSHLENACININDMTKKVNRELAIMKATHKKVTNSKIITVSSVTQQPQITEIDEQDNEEVLSNAIKKGVNHISDHTCDSEDNKSYFTVNHISNNNKSDDCNKVVLGENFEFLVPSHSVKSVQKMLKKDGDMRNYSLNPNTNGKSNAEFKQFSTEYGSEVENADFNGLSEIHSVSMTSSADSSLGILSLNALEDVKNQPLTEFSLQDKLDLSQRLAKQLSLNTSYMRDSEFDISLLASARLKEVVASRYEANKENSRNDERKIRGSDHYTILGYSSDSSDIGKNNTAKEFCGLSSNTIGETELRFKDSSCLPKKPLSEWNSTFPTESYPSNSTKSMDKLSYQNCTNKQSVSSNPFGEDSKISVGSEEFQSGEDVLEKFRTDEETWQKEFGDVSMCSLSGIYADGDVSIRTRGEKLSISSFLRSGSGPLGCLDIITEDSQRPTFGLQVISPKKKTKSRPILPPPEDKSTFLISEIPVKDTVDVDPWNLQSLSHMHADNDSDVSVPSLSCIGDLLADMGSGFNPREMMERLMGASRNKNVKPSSDKQYETSLIALKDSALSQCGKQEKLKTITTVIAGENSFCRGYESDHSTRYSSSFNSHLTLDKETIISQSTQARPTNEGHSIITKEDSVTPSLYDFTDCYIEDESYVCVLMPESMDFDVFNDYPRPQQYCIIKACYVQGHRQDSAALIYLPVTSLTLQPGEKRVISVTVAALIEGTIKIKLEVIRTDLVTQETEHNNVLGKIVAELPKISMLSSSILNLKPVFTAEFLGEYQEEIQIKNNGLSSVPLQLSLIESKHNSVEMFYFDHKKSRTVNVMLKPGEAFKQIVFCQTPPVLEIPKQKGELSVMAVVEVLLASPVQVQLPPLVTISANVKLKPNFFCAPSNLLVPPSGSASFKLYNSSFTPFTFKSVITNDFIVQPSMFALQPYQTVTLIVSYIGGLDRSEVCQGSLNLQVVEIHTTFSINLQKYTDSSSNSNFVTPQSSRATSPTSPCSSITGEGLHLACTHKELVWGGCTLQQRAVRICSLKNHRNRREKLLLKITDLHKCFKILNEKQGLESEIKLSLQPMESRQISVVMLAGSTGPKWGHLTISRINSPLDKKVLPLYAFGGKAKVNIEGILQDPEQHMWLYLDSDSLSSTFTLTNNGDYFAFVKISEGMSATTIGGGLSIAPPEAMLPPGHSVSVEIRLFVTPERLEYLLAQSSQTAICITRLAVTHGDESTRLRLSRLSRVNPKLSKKLSLINQLLPVLPIPDIDRLGDPSGCAETLWLEDVSEWTVGVLVKRSALEALRLDTSLEFVDLATTVIH